MSKPLSHLPIFSFSLLLILSFSYLPIISEAWAATYYVDATNGNDGYDGLSEVTPWQTIAKVNASNFNPGDQILFKRREIWRAQLTVPSSGAAGKPITFGAYGSGVNPIINGANLITPGTSWSAYLGNWSTTYTQDSAWAYDTGIARNARNVLNAADISISGSSIRVTFKGHNTTNYNILGASIGERNGTTDDFASTPTRITFDSGSSTTTVNANSTKVSDAITFSIDETKNYLIHIFLDSGTFPTVAASDSGGRYYKESNTDSTMVQTWTSDASSAWWYMVSLIEVQVLPANVWQATLTTKPWAVYFDGTLGTEVATLAGVTSANKWYWDSNILYTYSTSDPDSAFTSPGIEAAIRTYCIFADIKNYITYRNLDLTHSGYDGIRHENSSAIILDGITAYWNGWKLLSGVNAEGISLAGIAGLMVQNSVAHHNGWNGISVVRACSSVIIQNSTAHSNGHNGFDFKAEDWHDTDFGGAKEVGSITSPVIRYCLAYSNGQNGIYFEDDDEGHISDPNLYYNLLYANNLSGIYLAKGDGKEINGALIYNNTCYANGQSNWGSGLEAYITGSTIKNNIFYYNQVHGDSERELYVNNGGGAANTSNYNLIYSPINAYAISWNGNARTFATFRSVDGQEANGISSAPLFVSTSDFHLQPSSPAINAVTNAGLTSDYEGNHVPFGPAPDIGAYEYH